MSGNSLMIMPSPGKSDNHDGQCNIGVRCNSIQSSVTTSSQVYQYQVIAYQSSGDRYQVSGIRC